MIIKLVHRFKPKTFQLREQHKVILANIGNSYILTFEVVF